MTAPDKPTAPADYNDARPPGKALSPPEGESLLAFFSQAKGLVFAAYPPDPELVADCMALNDPYGALDEDLSAHLAVRDKRAAARVLRRRELTASARLKSPKPATGADSTVRTTVRHEASEHVRSYGAIAGWLWRKRDVIKSAVAGAPWSVILIGLTWVASHTWRSARVGVSSASVESAAAPLTDDEKKELPQLLGSLWISKFASSVLQDLPSACTTELVEAAPSAPCIWDVSSRLHKIVVSEKQERQTIAKLQTEVSHWCPRDGGPESARLLFDEDFISKVLWWPFEDYSKSVGQTSAANIDCEHEIVRTRRAVAQSKLAQYDKLVSEIVKNATRARDILSSKLGMDALTTPASAQAASPDLYVTLLLRNAGLSDAEIDTTSTLELSSDDGKCKRVLATISPLDSYSHRPTRDTPVATHIVVPQGGSSKLQLTIDCKQEPCPCFASPSAHWTIFVDGKDFPFSFQPR